MKAKLSPATYQVALLKSKEIKLSEKLVDVMRTDISQHLQLQSWILSSLHSYAKASQALLNSVF